MTLSTFAPAFNPSVNGSTKRVTARVLESKFGDSYSQRAQDGLNSVTRIFSAQWDVLSATDADAIEGFFEDLAGVTAFLWTIPDESTERKFIAKSWSRAYLGGDNYSFTAELEQVFDL